MSAPLSPLTPADDVGQQEAVAAKQNETEAGDEHGNMFLRILE